MDIANISKAEAKVKSMGFTDLFKEEKSATSTLPAVDKCFDSIKERITQYRKVKPNIITAAARPLSSASSDEQKEREEMWQYIPCKLECFKKSSFDDMGENLWVGHNPTPFDGFGFWEFRPEEPIEAPRWVIEYVNKFCHEYSWRSLEKTEEQLASETGRGQGNVMRCAIGYCNTLVREPAKKTYQLKPI